MLAKTTPKEEAALIAEAEEIRKASIALARTNFDEFAELVMVNESTGDSIVQQWFHEDWTSRRLQHPKAVFISAINLGKSNQFSIAYPVWMLGRNPRLRIAIVSKAAGLAKQLTDACAKLIEESPTVKEIFPNLAPGTPWNSEDRRVVRPPQIKDPSLKPIGVGTSIMGMRFDIIILDDVQDGENSRLESRRDLLEQWVIRNPLNRLEVPNPNEEPKRVYFVGNAWHPDDIYERLSKRGWPTFRYPVRVNKKLLEQCPYLPKPAEDGGLGMNLGDAVWPSRFSTEILDKEQADELPSEWSRARMCEAREDDDARFQPAWIENALRKGQGIGPWRTTRDFLVWDDPALVDELDTPDEFKGLGAYDNPNGNFWVVSGVDLSSGESTDLTSIVTVAICKQRLTRFLLSVESGKWQAPTIIERIKDAHARYGSLCIVENNGVQGYIRQLLERESTIPITKYNTSWTKADPSRGIEQIAKELHNNKWVLPSRSIMGQNCAKVVGADEEIEYLCADLRAYDPDPRAHTGDRMMALWFAQIMAVRLEQWQVKRTAREGAWKDYNGD